MNLDMIERMIYGYLCKSGMDSLFRIKALICSVMDIIVMIINGR